MKTVDEPLYFGYVEGKTVDEFCDKLRGEVLRRMESQEGTIINVEIGTESEQYGPGEYPRVIVTVRRPETAREKKERLEQEARTEQWQRQTYESLRKRFEK
jgi:hypothetical protein